MGVLDRRATSLAMGGHNSGVRGVITTAMLDELQKIYDSEINVEIRWMWDAGVAVKLGDEMNGYKAEENVTSLSAVVPWLQEAIRKHYPTSTYNLDRLKALPDKVVEMPVRES